MTTTAAAPTERVFERCPNPNPHTGSSCKRRGCRVCGVGWARNVGAVTKVNLEEYVGSGGSVVMISVTPPGQELLPWACTRSHQHGPKYGCKVEDDAADTWSANCRENWKLLRDAARKRVKRAGLPTDTLVLERVWEPQKRGVPHIHVIAGAGSEIERIAAQRFAEELSALAGDYFFGRVDRGKRVPNQACPVSNHRDGAQLHECICKRRLQLISAHEASRYLTSYLTGRQPKKASIRENISHPRMPRSLWWVTPKLTRITFVTMRRLRYARWYFAALHKRVDVYPRLFGEMLFTVARACVRIEPKKARAPGEDDDQAVARHILNLKLMRRIQPPWDVDFAPRRRIVVPELAEPEAPVDPIGVMRWDQLQLLGAAA